LIVGFFTTALFYLSHKTFGSLAGSSPFLRLTFTSYIATVDILYWKGNLGPNYSKDLLISGIWEGVSCFFGDTYLVAWIILAISSLILTLTRCHASTISAPIGIGLDLYKEPLVIFTWSHTGVSKRLLNHYHFDPQTFSSQPEDVLTRRIRDICVQMFVEMFVVLSWFGMWTLQDLYLGDAGFSYVGSAWVSLV